jgi:predicted membrane GTPase involved in stress response
VKEEEGERFELEEGATSLKLLQKVYRSPAVALTTRIRAAMAALQFEHPKLAVTATVNAGDFADQLEKAIERSRRVSPMIEAKANVNVSIDNPSSSDTTNVSSDSRRPSNGGKPTIIDRRYRSW